MRSTCYGALLAAICTMLLSSGCASLSTCNVACAADCDACGGEGCTDGCTAECGDKGCGGLLGRWFGRKENEYCKTGYCEIKRGPIGEEQKCRNGLLWPPYARPIDGTRLVDQYHAARFWPYPYTCEDRNVVRNLIAIQQQNGWMEAVTLYSYHFDPESHALTDPGRQHLDWILRHAPDTQRTVFIQSSGDSMVSNARLANVEAASTELLAGSEMPPIMLRTTLPNGRPANQVDSIHRAALEAQLPPRITYSASGLSGGSGSSQ